MKQFVPIAFRSCVVLAAFVAIEPATAQVGYSAACLEELVARADLVVRASVRDVVRGAPRDQRLWVTVTLDVHETLKGQRDTRLTFAREILSFDKIYEGWRDANREQLWFFAPNEEYDVREGSEGTDLSSRYPQTLRSVVRLGPPVEAERGFVLGPPPIFDMNLAVLTNRAEILKSARIAAKEPRSAGSHRLDLPRDVMQRTSRSGDANSLAVPVDYRLERLALRLIKSPGEFAMKLDDVAAENKSNREFAARVLESEKCWLCAEGAEALRYFKSDANIGVLMPLLANPAVSIVHGPGGETNRVYYVRKAAFTVLRDWGVDVEQPVLSVPLAEPDAECTD